MVKSSFADSYRGKKSSAVARFFFSAEVPKVLSPIAIAERKVQPSPDFFF